MNDLIIDASTTNGNHLCEFHSHLLTRNSCRSLAETNTIEFLNFVGRWRESVSAQMYLHRVYDPLRDWARLRTLAQVKHTRTRCCSAFRNPKITRAVVCVCLYHSKIILANGALLFFVSSRYLIAKRKTAKIVYSNESESMITFAKVKHWQYSEKHEGEKARKKNIASSRVVYDVWTVWT